MAKYADFSHSCITYKVVYKVVDLYAGLEFGTFFDRQEGGSTYAD